MPQPSATKSDTTPVQASYDSEGEAWWCDAMGDDDRFRPRRDICGGQWVGEVPTALWEEHQAALDTLTRTRLAMSDHLGLHPTEMRLAEHCDAYQGDSSTHFGTTWWHDCDRCGWPKEDHV